MRHLWLATAAALGTLALVAPAAQAADPIVVSNTTVLGRIQAFRHTLVYKKRTGKEQGVWMRRVGGKTLRATRIPNLRRVGIGEMGVDSHGRTVLVFYRQHVSATGVLRSTDWFVYDVASNRARPLKGLPAGHEAGKPPLTTLKGCFVSQVSIWRSRMVYNASCDTAARSGLWVREGKRTFRLTADNGVRSITLRGGTLAGLMEDGNGDVVVMQFMHEGKRCIKRIDSSFIEGDDPWAPSGVWIANGRITWLHGTWAYAAYGDFALLSSKLASGC